VRPTGIEPRHRSGCPAPGGRCSCRPAYRAEVWSPAEGKRIRRTFPTLAAARGWRADASGIKRGRLRAGGPTLRAAGEAWVAGAEEGSILTRSGDPFKPSAVRGYAAALRKRIYPELGGRPLADIDRPALQRLVWRLQAEGIDPSTVRNALMPVRALYRRALAAGEIAANPTTGLEMPAVRGRRDRVVGKSDAAALVAAAPDPGVWATALYAGLRLGELQALRWGDIDPNGVIRVSRSWDPKAGPIAPKSAAGTRSVPIPGALRGYLANPGPLGALVFGRRPGVPFNGPTVTKRAHRAWKGAGLAPIGLHEARHTYASMMIAAGVNAKALSTYMGHATIAITMDRYGHLMPGNEAEAAELFDRYLDLGQFWGQSDTDSGGPRRARAD